MKGGIGAAREQGIEVIYVQHDDGPDTGFSIGDDEFEVYSEFQPMPDEKRFIKSVCSAFKKESGLLEYLTAKEEKDVMICGIMFFVNLPTKEKYIIMEGQTKLSAGQIGILINARIKDMAMWLMEDFKYSLEEALDCVYNSELFEKLQDLETGLYYQSSGYNYELLKEEIKYGKVG